MPDSESKMTPTAPSPPPVAPTARSKGKGKANRDRLLNTVDLQIQAVVEDARVMVVDAADVVAQIYAAVPAMIQVEAADRLEATMPLIEQSNEALIQETRAAAIEATAKSRQSAQDFLGTYGIALVSP